MCPVAWSNNLFNQTALPVHNETFWDSSSTIEAFYRPLGIEQGGKREPIIAHEWGHDLRPQGINTDSQYFQATGAEPFMETLDGRHLFDTGRTPRGPHVNEHDLPAQG